MSQLSLHSQEVDRVSISIAKFSHNTSPYGTRNFTWNHISDRNDLVLNIRKNQVFDANGNPAIRVSLLVTAGPIIFEEQDLTELVKYADTFDPSTGADKPVDVVIKSPFLAMKFPKSINTVRRMQVKFRTDSEFTRVWNVMRDIGLPITNREAPAPTVPTSSSRSTISPVPSISPALSVSSAATSITLSNPISRPSSAVIPPINQIAGISGRSGSPLKSEFKIPGRPASASASSDAQLRSHDSVVSRHFPPPSTSLSSQNDSHVTAEIVRPFSTAFNATSYPSLLPECAIDGVQRPLSVSFHAPLSTSQRPDFAQASSQPENYHFTHSNEQPGEKEQAFRGGSQPERSSVIFENRGEPYRSLTAGVQSAKPLYVSQLEKESRSSEFDGSSVISGRDFTDNSITHRSLIPKVSREDDAVMSEAMKNTSTTSHFFSKNYQRSNTPIGNLHDPFYDGPRSDAPSSASTPATIIDDLWLPPKRILPFPVPADRNKSKTTLVKEPPTSSTPASSINISTITTKSSAEKDFVTKVTPIPAPKPLARASSASGKTVQPAGSIKTPVSSMADQKNDAKDSVVTPAGKAAPKKRAATRKSTNIAKPVTELQVSKGIEEIFVQPAVTPESQPSPLAAKSTSTLSRPASAASALVSKEGAPQKRAPIQRPSSAAATLVSKAAPPKKREAQTRTPLPNKRLKTVDQGTQTDENQSINSTSTQTRAISNLPSLIADSPSVSSPPESYEEQIDNFISRHAARPRQIEVWETPGYADADDEMREKIVNDFICEQLDNPDFHKLLEDMGKSWRRIGLGM